MEGSKELIGSAEAIAELLKRHRIDALVIGGVALAAHRYVRHTDDVDLGINASLASLRSVDELLKADGYSTVLREPVGMIH